jgi:hypothetical protein
MRPSRPEEGKKGRPLPRRKVGSDLDSDGQGATEVCMEEEYEEYEEVYKDFEQGRSGVAVEAAAAVPWRRAGSAESRNGTRLRIFDHRIGVCTGRTPTSTSTELSDDVLLRSMYAQKDRSCR